MKMALTNLSPTPKREGTPNRVPSLFGVIMAKPVALCPAGLALHAGAHGRITVPHVVPGTVWNAAGVVRRFSALPGHKGRARPAARNPGSVTRSHRTGVMGSVEIHTHKKSDN